MFQFLTKVGYLCGESLSSLRRGGWMNWAAISTITVLLFLFGVCLQTSWQLESLLEHFGNQLEISVYLTPETQGETIIPMVRDIPHVKNIRAISKERAWQSLLEELGIADAEEATEQLEGNPLVDELKAIADSARAVPKIVAQLNRIPGVDRTIYVNEARERLQQIQRGLSWIGIVLTSILSLTAIAVVTTTLNLIAVARRNELEIMQLVGATKVWIFLPFIFQGIIFGLIGGALALILMTTMRALLANLFFVQTDFLKFLTEGLRLSLFQLRLLPIVIFSLGISVGTIGSFFAIRRFSFR
ncbi:MAG: ABC transporter permease [Cyanobacteria bacterium SBLK]|nr:ABC transporter permease [Cyanobacteria bacterium SBLK]